MGAKILLFKDFAGAVAALEPPLPSFIPEEVVEAPTSPFLIDIRLKDEYGEQKIFRDEVQAEDAFLALEYSVTRWRKFFVYHEAGRLHLPDLVRKLQITVIAE